MRNADFFAGTRVLESHQGLYNDEMIYFVINGDTQ